MTSSQPDDLTWLHDQFPGWEFDSLWITANSGPDRRRLWACRGAVFLSAWTAPGLAEQIRTCKFPAQNGAS
jgi:hypothetical protein